MDEFSATSLLGKSSAPLGLSQCLCFVGERFEIRGAAATEVSPYVTNCIAVEGLLMSAKHVAKESSAWTRELGAILLDGIQDNRQGKQQAQGRVKALHPLPPGKDRYPKDFEKWLTKVFEKPSGDGVAPWLSLEFWQHEVDKA